MSTEQPILLCDFGGTHGRLGLLENDKISKLRKYKLSEFETHIDLFNHYKKETGIKFLSIAIAAAGGHVRNHFPSGLKQNSKISEGYLSSAGYQLLAHLNDFEASAWGVLDPKVKQVVLHEATSLAPETAKCVIGPGTGLGCGMVYQDGRNVRVMVTSGGHMRPCGVTKEHYDVLLSLQEQQELAVIYEDIASGRGLEKLYKLITGDNLPHPSIIIDEPDNIHHQKILRLFHEFLGLYIQNVIVTNYAYGGVILNGGLIDVLQDRNLFNFDAIHKMICQPYVKVINERLKSVPVSYINDSYLALYGLQNYLESLGDA